MATYDRELGGEPPCLMASLNEDGSVPDAPAPAATHDFARRDPPHGGPEHAMLQSFLDYHRATLVQKVEGLRDADLRRRLVPSATTLLGLVKHLAYVERWWFQIVFAGEDLPVPWSEEDPDADFRVEPNESTAQILRFYQEQVRRSREITASASLDEITRRPGRDHTLRWIMLHMVEETARHNGHADILRELIDGATGE